MPTLILCVHTIMRFLCMSLYLSNALPNLKVIHLQIYTHSQYHAVTQVDKNKWLDSILNYTFLLLVEQVSFRIDSFHLSRVRHQNELSNFFIQVILGNASQPIYPPLLLQWQWSNFTIYRTCSTNETRFSKTPPRFSCQS